MGAHVIVTAPVASSETIPPLADLTVQADCDTASCTCCEVAANNLAVAILALKNRIQFVNSGLIPDVIGHGGTGAADSAGWNDPAYILNITPIGYEGDCPTIYAFYLTFISEIEYWIDTLYASGVWLDTVTYPDADIEGTSGALDYFGAGDYTHQTLPLASDSEFCTLFTANVAAIQLAIQQLQAVTVAATNTDLWAKFTSAGEGGGTCAGNKSCAVSNHPSGAYAVNGVGSAYHYTTACALFVTNSENQGSSVKMYSGTDATQQAACYNGKSKIQADLTNYVSGSAVIYLMLAATSGGGETLVFGQPRPTTADAGKWGKWTGGSIALGGNNKSGFFGDVDAISAGACPSVAASGDTGSGWILSNQIVVLDGNFF